MSEHALDALVERKSIFRITERVQLLLRQPKEKGRYCIGPIFHHQRQPCQPKKRENYCKNIAFGNERLKRVYQTTINKIQKQDLDADVCGNGYFRRVKSLHVPVSIA